MNIETLIKRLGMFKANASLIMTADEVQQHIDLLESQQKTIEDMKQKTINLENNSKGWIKVSKIQISMIEELIKEKNELKQ